MPGRRRMRWIWPVETNFTRLQRRAPLPVGRMMFRRTIFSLALVVLVQAGWSPAAQASETASGFVQQLGEQAIHALREDSGSLAQRETQFRALLVEGFDLNLIGRFVLGRAWKSADKYQRESYLRAFGEFIVRKYSAMLGGYAGETMTVVSEQARAGKTSSFIPASTDRADRRSKRIGGCAATAAPSASST